MAVDRPETVTVVFTDVVGSTAWRALVGGATTDLRMTEGLDNPRPNAVQVV
jgi:class 3 adenylate cyclase